MVLGNELPIDPKLFEKDPFIHKESYFKEGVRLMVELPINMGEQDVQKTTKPLINDLILLIQDER